MQGSTNRTSMKSFTSLAIWGSSERVGFRQPCNQIYFACLAGIVISLPDPPTTTCRFLWKIESIAVSCVHLSHDRIRSYIGTKQCVLDWKKYLLTPLQFHIRTTTLVHYYTIRRDVMYRAHTSLCYRCSFCLHIGRFRPGPANDHSIAFHGQQISQPRCG